MSRNFRRYSLDKHLLLPPNLRDWVPEGHLSHYVSDVVDQLARAPSRVNTRRVIRVVACPTTLR
jgi:hypothetical protein